MSRRAEGSGQAMAGDPTFGKILDRKTDGIWEASPVGEHGYQKDLADKAVEFANSLARENPDMDTWQIADALLSGIVHWWLYANSPCSDLTCVDCENIRTAELRMAELHQLVNDMAETSDYYHSPNDTDVAHA